MKALDKNIYIDHFGVKHVLVRNVGYQEYAYLKEDGTVGVCGGAVGPSCGWKTVEESNQNKGDLAFRLEVANG